MKVLYFDHSASTPIHEQVADTVSEVMKLHYANAASLHAAGVAAGKLVARARAAIAGSFDVSPDEVVFTSGGTESNNLALKGHLHQQRQTTVPRQGTHFITTMIEHASVYQCAKQLEADGVEVTWLEPDRSGRIDPDDVARAVRKNTALVSVMHVNSETGAVQPIREIGAALAASPWVKLHVDGVQAIGKVPVDMKGWGIDMYSGSAHKFRGPKGTGFLLVREGLKLTPLLAGGSQENGVRGGTHNVPSIVGMAQALRLALESMESRRARMFNLRRKLLGIVADIPELALNGSDADEQERTAPHIVNLSFPGMRPEVLVHKLEQRGILISTQSACSSKSLQPSRVLLAMGHDAARASGSIRISFGDEHTEDDIELLGERLRQAVGELNMLERGGL